MLNELFIKQHRTSSKRATVRGSVLIEAVMVMLLFLAFVGAVMYWSLTLQPTSTKPHIRTLIIRPQH